MIRLYKRVLGLMLAVALVLPLAACQDNSGKGQVKGIKIDEDVPYTEETLEYAEQTVFSLVIYAYRQAVLDKITDKVEKRLADYARRICEITAAKPILEEQYVCAIQLLESQGEAAIDEIVSLYKGNSTDCEKSRRLYLDLSSALGADHVASILYDCCLMIYDARYERTVEKMEIYQYPWYKEEAEALASEKAVFENSIGREDFCALIRCSTAMAELMSIEAGEIPNTFSNAELLEIIRHLKISEIDVDEAGWKLLLSNTFTAKGSPYRTKLCEALTESGDIDCLAKIMQDVLELLSIAMDRLTAEDINLVREGRQEELAVAVFSKFDDKDWSLFEAVTSVSLSNEQYSALATEEYGEDYSVYIESLQPINAQNLRANLDNPAFYSYLLDYLAAICPAISYEVRA